MAKRVGAKTWSAQSHSKAKSKGKTQYQHKKNRRQKWRERIAHIESSDELEIVQ
ncbi:MAG: hypothetical protein P1V97_13045 [Planctomycetota bacterium]|nr:hypothetical protein [Planctomycetota bacterium]